MLSHPLVSPVLQPTLGGLPPLLIMTGGGEILRDEQIYLAHKCANPEKYLPGDIHMDEAAREQVSRFKPTDVQLQIWDDLCHVAPTLSFTRPAKYMYRSVAQFGAWALARAQKTGIEILDDDDISVISSSGTDSEGPTTSNNKEAESSSEAQQAMVGKAGDPLPPFQDHMIRQRVNRHGVTRPLEPATEIPACVLNPNEIGTIKEGPVRKWLEARSQYDTRFSNARVKIHKRRLKEMMAGYQGFDGETPPPSALAARRKVTGASKTKARRKSIGLSLWSLWGSKHDEMTVQREEVSSKTPDVKTATKQDGQGARSPSDLQKQERDQADQRPPTNRSQSKTKMVTDENQTSEEGMDANTPIAILMAKREGKAPQDAPGSPASNNELLTPYNVAPSTGVAGKRPIVGGIAVPFSLGKEADTASMITLTSTLDPVSRIASPTSSRFEIDDPRAPSPAGVELYSDMAGDAAQSSSSKVWDLNGLPTPTEVSPLATPTPTGNGYVSWDGNVAKNTERPPMETFVTAQEDLPRLH